MAQSNIGGSPETSTGSPSHAPSDAPRRTQDRARGSKDKRGALGRQAADSAARSAKRGGDAGARVQDVASNCKTARDTARWAQPMATLAAAAIAGFVHGALSESQL